MRFLFPIIVLILIMAACGPQPEGDATELKWGHLATESLRPGSPYYLINQLPNEPYRVCLTAGMAARFPGIDAEIAASINIWAYYIGRTIKVEITEKQLPPAAAIDTPESLGNSYHRACGDGYDVVVGLFPFAGNAVGQTNAPSDRDNEPFRRYLFLREYGASRDFADEVWTALESRLPGVSTTPDILRVMAGRQRIFYTDSRKKLLAPALMHEFGHVWGLCDQYGAADNCSSHYGSASPEPHSVMGASGARDRIFLTDDDITGIRELAGRAGFSRGWENADASFVFPAAIHAGRDVELLNIAAVQRRGDGLTVTYSVVTERPARYWFDAKRRGTSGWERVTLYWQGPAGFAEVDAGTTINPDSDVDAVRIQVQVQDDLGRYRDPQAFTFAIP